MGTVSAGEENVVADFNDDITLVPPPRLRAKGGALCNGFLRVFHCSTPMLSNHSRRLTTAPLSVSSEIRSQIMKSFIFTALRNSMKTAPTLF